MKKNIGFRNKAEPIHFCLTSSRAILGTLSRIIQINNKKVSRIDEHSSRLKQVLGINLANSKLTDLYKSKQLLIAKVK